MVCRADVVACRANDFRAGCPPLEQACGLFVCDADDVREKWFVFAESGCGLVDCFACCCRFQQIAGTEDALVKFRRRLRDEFGVEFDANSGSVDCCRRVDDARPRDGGDGLRSFVDGGMPNRGNEWWLNFFDRHVPVVVSAEDCLMILGRVTPERDGGACGDIPGDEFHRLEGCHFGFGQVRADAHATHDVAHDDWLARPYQRCRRDDVRRHVRDEFRGQRVQFRFQELAVLLPHLVPRTMQIEDDESVVCFQSSCFVVACFADGFHDLLFGGKNFVEFFHAGCGGFRNHCHAVAEFGKRVRLGVYDIDRRMLRGVLDKPGRGIDD